MASDSHLLFVITPSPNAVALNTGNIYSSNCRILQQLLYLNSIRGGESSDEFIDSIFQELMRQPISELSPTNSPQSPHWIWGTLHLLRYLFQWRNRRTLLDSHCFCQSLPFSSPCQWPIKDGHFLRKIPNGPFSHHILILAKVETYIARRSQFSHPWTLLSPFLFLSLKTCQEWIHNIQIFGHVYPKN